MKTQTKTNRKNWQAILAGSTIALASMTLSACGADKSETATSEQAATETQALDPHEAAEQAMHGFEEKMGTMGKMLENPEAFDIAKFQQTAESLATSADKPWEYFGKMNENPDFVAEIEKFKTATAKLNTIAQNATTADEVKEAFGAVGATCKSCHMLPHDH